MLACWIIIINALDVLKFKLVLQYVNAIFIKYEWKGHLSS